MGTAKRRLVITSTKRNTVLLSEAEKAIITAAFADLIADFKKKCIKSDPDKKYSYLIDIYSKWHRNYFYIIEKHKCDFENRVKDEFERKLIRLEYTKPDEYTFSYLRHTEQWHIVSKNIYLINCKEMILDNPNFQPIQL